MKQTETKHTQGEWKTDGEVIFVENKLPRYIARTGRTMTGNIDKVILPNEADANAEMICRAVNCHDELVEVLENFIEAWRDHRHEMYMTPSQREVLKNAKAALQKASL